MSPLVVTPHDAPPALGNHRTGLRHQRDKRSRWKQGFSSLSAKQHRGKQLAETPLAVNYFH